jgi:hypothetical protein
MWRLKQHFTSNLHHNSFQFQLIANQEKRPKDVSCSRVNVPIFSHHKAWLLLLLNITVCFCPSSIRPIYRDDISTFVSRLVSLTPPPCSERDILTPDTNAMFRSSFRSASRNLSFGPLIVNILILVRNFRNHSEPIVLERRGAKLHGEKMNTLTGERDNDFEPFSQFCVGWSWNDQ